MEYDTVKGSGMTRLVYMPDHPRASVNRGYVYEHILVMEEKLGRSLHKEEVIHHINGITFDNNPDNLKLFRNNSEHIRFHTMQRSFEKTGSLHLRKCWICGEYDNHNKGHMYFNGKSSYCHKRCKSEYDKSRYRNNIEVAASAIIRARATRAAKQLVFPISKEFVDKLESLLI